MKLDQRIGMMLTEQVTLERLAEAAYRAVACWADFQSLRGLTKWADGEADEERDHQLKILNYLRDRDRAMLQPVPAPQFDFADYADALDYLLKVEQGVTMALNRIVEEAGVVGCYPTQELIWPLLPIQVQSEKTLNDALIKVRRSKLTRFEIMMLDFELWGY